MVQVFNVQIFFVCFRESLEAAIVVSTLLAFLKQGIGAPDDDPKTYKRLRRQVWLGTIIGVLICVILGCAFIGAFYGLGKDIWGGSEDLWESIFCLIAAILITMMGLPMLRINKMQEKWRVKLAKALVHTNKKDRFKLGNLMKRYAMFILPFITCLREGLEAVVFIGGVGLNSPASAFPIPVIVGLLAGCVCGILLYYFGSAVSLKVFLIISTCILYLIAAGLFSRGVWYAEMYEYAKKTGGDAAENGSGPGTYDITKSVWHVNCCNPSMDHGWDIFNALFGWQNSATYGSVISYNAYWILILAILGMLMYEEKHGHLPFTKSMTLAKLNPMYHIKGKKKYEMSEAEKQDLFNQVKNQNAIELQEVDSLQK